MGRVKELLLLREEKLLDDDFLLEFFEDEVDMEVVDES